MVKFIAEVGSNHNGNFGRAVDLIEAASKAGFGAVKFQWLDIEKMFAPEILQSRPDIAEKAQGNFDPGWLPKLRAACHQNKVEFGLSVYLVEQVAPAVEHVDFLKVASYSLLHFDLLEEIRDFVVPVYLSTGMAYSVEVREAKRRVQWESYDELILMHCVSQYPTPPADANLAAIKTLRDKFGCPVGWSDHTGSKGVIHRAIHKWGAVAVELHVDLDDFKGFEAGPHVWAMGRAASLIAQVRNGFEADGDGIKQPRPGELTERDWRADTDGLRPMAGIRP